MITTYLPLPASENPIVGADETAAELHQRRQRVIVDWKIGCLPYLSLEDKDQQGQQHCFQT